MLEAGRFDAFSRDIDEIQLANPLLPGDAPRPPPELMPPGDRRKP